MQVFQDFFRKYHIHQLLILITVRYEVAKVMFLHVSVILFTGVCYPSMHYRWYPSLPCRRSLGGSALQGPGPGKVPGPRGPSGVPAPRGACLVWRGGEHADPPRKQTATVADGTYPIGMHSCFPIISIRSTNNGTSHCKEEK